jgi:phage protein D
MNNLSVQNRTGSKFTVTYPDFPTVTVPPHHITIHQEIGSQDVVELSYTRFNTFYQKVLKTGVPIHITWKNDKSSETFTGYVMDVTPVVQQSTYNPVIVRCVGASLTLKEGGYKIWKNQTGAQIISDIAKQFKLKPVVTEDNIIFSQHSLTGQTHWEKIQEISKRKGYVAHCYGTELHFHPLDKMIDIAMTTIPVFSFIEPFSNPFSSILSQTLDHFRPTGGDFFSHAENKRTTKTVSVVDPLTAKLSTYTNKANDVGKNLRTTTKDPLFKEILSGVITGTAKMAESLSSAHAQLSRFSVHAEGKGQGDPRVAPHRTIEINGTGSTTDGFWVIKKVTHKLAIDGRYQIDFTCMADGTGQNKSSSSRPSTAGKVPVRNLNYETTTGTTVKAASVKLNSVTPLIAQTNAGWKVTPRRWVGK